MPARNLTWRELAALPKGTRLVFPTGWESYPHYSFKPGTTGTMVGQWMNALNCWTIAVRPDDEAGRKALANWDGEILMSPADANGLLPENDITWDTESPVRLA